MRTRCLTRVPQRLAEEIIAQRREEKRQGIRK
jgi:hypothetical protein